MNLFKVAEEQQLHQQIHGDEEKSETRVKFNKSHISIYTCLFVSKNIYFSFVGTKQR